MILLAIVLVLIVFVCYKVFTVEENLMTTYEYNKPEDEVDAGVTYQRYLDEDGVWKSRKEPK